MSAYPGKERVVPAKPRKPTKRVNGQGSIRQKPNGTWLLQLSIPNPDPDSPQKTIRQSYVYPTFDEADEARTQKLSQQKKGLLLVSDKLTVGEFLDKWLNSPGVRKNLDATTYENYERQIRLHIAPHIGLVALAKLTPEHVEAMQERILAHRSARVAQLAHVILRMALQQAVRRKHLTYNPADLVDAPRPETREMRPLSEAEVNRFLAVTAGTPLHALYVTALGTGMRQGELFGLCWQDVDFAGKVIRVRQQAQRSKEKGLAFVDPKTDKSRRSIAVSDNVIAALKAHRDQQAFERARAGDKWAELDLVFPNESGRVLEKQNVQRRSFKPLLAQAGLPADQIRFHDLRHTHATLLFAKGVHPKVVQERLGHATIGITLDTYSHWIPSMGADAANLIDGLFAGSAAAI